MLKFNKLFTILVFVSLFISCATSKKMEVISEVETTISEEDKFQFQYNFFEANKFYLAGNVDMALSIYNQCLKIDPNSQAVHYQLASIYALAKDFGKASFHADNISKNTDNVWYLYLAGSIYAQSNQTDKAINVFNKLIKLDPKKMDYYLSLSDVYIQNKNLDEAIKVYDLVDKNFGKSEIISVQKGKIYLSQNKKNAAIKEFESLAKFYNNDAYYLRLLADLYIQVNQIDDAINVYLLILENNREDGYSNIGLAECYRLKGDFEKSFSYIKVAFQSKELPSDIKIQLIYNIIQNAQNNETLKAEINVLIKDLYDQYPSNNDVKILYVNLLISESNYTQARILLREIVKVKKDNYSLWEQLILLDNEFSDWENMYITVNEAVKLFPTQTFLHFFKGFCCLQLEKYNESLEALSFGYRLTTNKDPLRKDFISYLGEVNHKLGKKEKAYSYFDQYLNLEPSNNGILNNYAYYLSVDSLNLEKANQMSKITVDSEPNNSTFLDTYAWVLFKQKDYDTALIYIKKAVENNEDSSAVIIEHYGDILFFNNEIEKAIIQWSKAYSIDSTNEKLKLKIDEKRFIP